MHEVKWELKPENIEWEMDWSDTKPDGTRKWPDQPEKEMVFEEEPALAHLLMNDVMFYNGEKLYVNCNDVFAWGCADGEELKGGELENLYRLWQREPMGGAEVWCIIQRRELPQRPVAKRLTELGWDLDELTKEHDLRPNAYDSLSMLHATRKYNLYCEWERANGREPRPFDAGWWTGWNEYRAAHPDFKEYEGEFHAETMRQRDAWLAENGFDWSKSKDEEIDVVRRSILIQLCDRSEGRWQSGCDDDTWKDAYETGLTDAIEFLREEIVKLPSPPNDNDWEDRLGWVNRTPRPTYNQLAYELAELKKKL